MTFSQIFQQLEEERIYFLRNEMWVNTNILSQTCVDDDQVSYSSFGWRYTKRSLMA